MHTVRKEIIRASRVAALVAGLVALAASAASAQGATGPRWKAWVGCWTAAPSSADAVLPAGTSVPIVCVVPTNNSDAVEVSTIADGKVVSHTRIDASGAEQPVELKGCTGTQRGQWSADGRRVFLKATTTCEGLQRNTSGIIAMSPTGEWLDVQGVIAGGGDNLRVARYRDAGVPASVPADIAAALNGRNESTQAARIAAGALVGTSAVIEASRSADPAVVEGWLLERRQPFALDANGLVALADAGVPARVTDAMVAVSNPKNFAIARPEGLTRTDGVIEANDIAPGGRRILVQMDPWSYDPYGYGAYGLGSYYSGYGYNSFGRGGYGYPGYYYGSPIIVAPGATAGTRNGRMVKGRGYTRDEQTGRATSSSPSWSSPSTNSGSGSGSGTGTSSGSSSGSSSSGSSTRTAKPRP